MTQETTDVKLKVDKEDLRELIKDITSGVWRLYLPQFQRAFEWDSDDVMYFLDSVIQNLPVGSVILWKPRRRIEEDPFAIPLIDVELKREPTDSFYVLDGQQRLTSLLLLYSGWKISRRGEKISLDDTISYVPAKNELAKGTRRGVDLSTLFRAYLDGRFESVVKDYPRYKDDIEKIVRRIVDYEIPIYTIETTGEDDKVLAKMADAFIRINKAGVRIGTVELMLSFIAGMVSGSFSRKVRELYRRLERYDLDLNVLIRFVLSNFEIKQTVFSNVNQFRSNVEKIRFDDNVLRNSEKSISLVMELLRRELGLSTCRIIPSQVALIPIATYFYEKNVDSISNLDEGERKYIVDWFVLVNMKGHYSSSTNSKLQRDIETVKEKTSTFPYSILISSLGERRRIRKADIEKGNGINVLRKQGLQYLFLLYVLLVKEKAEDLDGGLLSSKPYSEIDRHHIFPRNILEKSEMTPDDPDERESFISGLGNITFVSKSLHKELPDSETPDVYLPRYLPLQKHFIPAQRDLWRLENFEEFRHARIEEIYKAAKKNFTEIVE